MSRRVLVIEPRSAGRALITRAADLGYHPVVLTADRDDRQVPAAILDRAAAVEILDTNDDAAVVAAAVRHHAVEPLDAVIAGFEHYVPVAAAVAARLGLRGLPAGIAANFRHKQQMRATVTAAGLDQPRWRLVEDETELARAVAAVGLPCVVKPVDQSGSLNVRKAATYPQARAAFRRIHHYGVGYLGRDGSPAVLVEEYADGPEFSVEGYLEQGEARVVGITEKRLGPEPSFVETGHMVPARLDEATAETIRTYVRDVVTALGLTLGTFHAELRLTDRGPLLIEVAARLPGDRIPDLLRLSGGADLYEITLRSHLGLPNDPAPLAGCRGTAGIHYFLRPDVRQYADVVVDPVVRGDQRIRELAITVPPGAPVPDPGSSAGRLGYAVAIAPTYQDTALALAAADAGVRFTADIAYPPPSAGRLTADASDPQNGATHVATRSHPQPVEQPVR